MDAAVCDIEMTSANKIMSPSATSENAKVPISKKTAGRENLEKGKGKEIKKKVLTAKKIAENATEHNAVVENATEQKTEDESNTGNKNAQSAEENKNDIPEKSKTNRVAHPPVAEMVLESFRNEFFRARNGISAEKIREYLGQNYQVNMNRIKPYIKKHLQKGVVNGLFDQVSGTGVDEKFKIRKTEKSNKRNEKLKIVTRKSSKKAEVKKGTVKKGTVKKETAKKGTVKKGTVKKGSEKIKKR